ncbi:MAG: heme-degrading domain-containing protein [Rhodocyclaceae bacterium]|nr:MAG: heme-degrading domain-containing protein [Rhodocyclaceae bacterium]
MELNEELARVAAQEAALRLTRFDEDIAWRLGTRLRCMAVERGLAIAIEIRRCGQLLFYAALPGTTPDNADWIRRKGNVVTRFLRSSYAIGLSLQQKGGDLTSRYGLPAGDYASHGGAFPLCVEGAGIIGYVAVSGLPQRDDHELVVAALSAELGLSYSPPPA